MTGAQPHLLSVSELCYCLAESWITSRLYLKELLQYKRQNPTKVSWESTRLLIGGWGSLSTATFCLKQHSSTLLLTMAQKHMLPNIYLLSI